jgi:hypothetical protein
MRMSDKTADLQFQACAWDSYAHRTWFGNAMRFFSFQKQNIIVPDEIFRQKLKNHLVLLNSVQSV